MKTGFRFALLIVFLGGMVVCLYSFAFRKAPKVLVFYKTNGFKHSSIPAGIKAIQKLAEENRFRCDTTSDSLKFRYKTLKQYDAVIFLNTTGDVLGFQEQKEFERYIQSGAGYVGIHAAADTEFDWPWYNQLVGAYFKDHPAQQQALLHVKDAKFPATAHLPREWSRWDEWYNYKDTHWDKVNVLLTLDEKTIKGGGNGDFHPMAWYRSFDGGRSFYTGLGHTEASYEDDLFLKHLLGGIKYAVGH